MTTYNGFYRCIMDEQGVIRYAPEGKFENGFSEIDVKQLSADIEGVDKLHTAILRALSEFTYILTRHDIELGLQWTLSADRMQYESCEVLTIGFRSKLF